VAEPTGHRSHVDASAEELGRNEMPEIVESNVGN